MDKTVFFSVVMPVYNVEKHLKKAVTSVLDQTFGDLELIIVDDCSPDKSGEIADSLAQEDNRIQVIHLEENVGLSFARNIGMQKACGKYIWFMDSDDAVDSNLLEEVHKAVSAHAPQVVVWGLVEEYYNQSGELSYTKDISYPKTVCENSTQVRKEIIDLEKSTLLGYAWNKAYALDYVRKLGLEFEKITLIEDILFNVSFVKDIEKMVILPITAYHYNKRIDSSLTNKFVKDYYVLHKKRVQLLYDLYDTWGLLDDDVKTTLASIYARYVFSALQRNCDKRSGMNAKARRQWLREVFADELFVDLASHMNGGQGVMKYMCACLMRRRALLCLSVGRLIYIFKDKTPVLFARLKQNR